METIKELLKLAPGIILLPFSLYFIWKKLGSSASASFQITLTRLNGARVSSVTIQNTKDKPLVIKDVYLVIDRNHYLALKKFETPLIIKGFEISNVYPDDVSSYHIGSDEIDDPFTGSHHFEIFITTPGKTFKCSEMKNFKAYRPKNLRAIQEVSITTNSFNGVVYTKNASYAIHYKDSKGEHLALVDHGGLIGRDWEYTPNAISSEDMISSTHIENLLRSLPFVKAFEWMYVKKLNHH